MFTDGFSSGLSYYINTNLEWVAQLMPKLAQMPTDQLVLGSIPANLNRFRVALTSFCIFKKYY